MKKFTKIYQKLLCGLLLMGVLSSVSSAGIDARTYYSADKSKSFKGTLIGYNLAKQQVRVRTTKGKDLNFKLSVLSEECQEYVKQNASLVVVASAMDISFEEVKTDKVKGASKDYTFDVTFFNNSETLLENLEVVYTVHYKKGNITKGTKSEEKTLKGTFDLTELDPTYRSVQTTEAVEIVTKTIKSKGGG